MELDRNEYVEIYRADESSFGEATPSYRLIGGFWAHIEDLPSPWEITGSNRPTDTRMLKLIGDSRDVDSVRFRDKLVYEGSSRVFEVTDYYDSKFKFMSTVLASHVDNVTATFTTTLELDQDVLDSITAAGGRYGSFALGTTTNPQPGQVSLEGNNRAVLGSGASWDSVVTIVEDTQDFTGLTTMNEHQILVVIDDDNFAEFDVIGDTSDANHLDFVTVTERSRGVIGQPFHVYLSTDDIDVSTALINVTTIAIN